MRLQLPALAAKHSSNPVGDGAEVRLGEAGARPFSALRPDLHRLRAAASEIIAGGVEAQDAARRPQPSYLPLALR